MSAGPLPAVARQDAVRLTALAERIESHCVRAWPAEVVQREPDGWIFRATPGLPGRGRSNHALTPVRPLHPSEIDPAIQRVTDFAAQHGVECGIQVGPIDFHIPLLNELDARGWEVQQAVLVMTAQSAALAAGADPTFGLEITDHATPEWVAAWQLCEPGRSGVQAHVETVFKLMAGNARFARLGQLAVGIIVELDGLAGLYCLAVNPAHRRQGLGVKLVRGLLRDSASELTYLQVFSANEAGVGLYNSLGFTEAYRYCHVLAPAASPETTERADGGC